MLEVLLGLSWALSILFAFSVGVIYGYHKAHKSFVEKIDMVKSSAFQLFEGVLNAGKKTVPVLADSLGGFDGRGVIESQASG